MSTVDGRGDDTGGTSSETVELKLEVVVIPVAGSDRPEWYSGDMVREHTGQELSA